MYVNTGAITVTRTADAAISKRPMSIAIKLLLVIMLGSALANFNKLLIWTLIPIEWLSLLILHTRLGLALTFGILDFSEFCNVGISLNF